ncbi:hypothetical protein GCM10009630_64260 [Kribbella jejuensis]|uniref:Uncharacterized protein n=1 Tax=Kribbella jejuensis TaxID=236068 RepID=A0A542ES35_9ACTN|nr:hypothetical protein [Kribbella jejuensis]TQJ18152.1 hypothetical protein FB475_2287 [Kribbella jejuensis]
MLASQRVRKQIESSALGALGDVVAANQRPASPQADAFNAYLNSDPQSRPQHAADSPERRLAAELIAADSRTNSMDPVRTERAQEYVAHAVVFDAGAEAGRAPGRPSQAPAAAAGPVGVPVTAGKAGVQGDKGRTPSIG